MHEKISEEFSEVRRCQRSHAKMRFEQRFGLQLNRDSIHDLELKIARGDAFAVKKVRTNLQNYLVEVNGALIAVGYNNLTRRLVTALPDDYFAQLPPEEVTRAEFKLLPTVQERVVGDILDGKARFLRRENDSRTFHIVRYRDMDFRVGYDAAEHRLVPYRRGSRADRCGHNIEADGSSVPLALQLHILDIPTEIQESFLAQMRADTSQFLWRASSTLTFHAFDWAGEKKKVGFSRTRQAFLQYQDPPADQAELHSSIQLLESPSTVINALTQMLRDGKAEALAKSDDIASYRVAVEGCTYFFDYNAFNGRILPWNRGRLK
jgi:hypothetical protein